MISILALFIFTKLLAQPSEINLLPNQPYYEQISGTCYAHAGNTVLVSLNLKNKKDKKTIVEPHPLLVTAFGKTHQVKGSITGGHSCDILSDAKELNEEICSVDALSLFLETKSADAKKGKRHFRDLINKFDETLSSYAALLSNSESFDKNDLISLTDRSKELQDNVCELSGLGLDQTEINSLMDFNKFIQQQVNEDLQRSKFDEVAELGTRVLAGQTFEEARNSQLVEDSARKKLKEEAATTFLKKFYRKLNKGCLTFQKELGLDPVDKDFFEVSKKISCTRMDTSKSVSDQDIKNIVAQVSSGTPVPVGLCAGPFMGDKQGPRRDDNVDCQKTDDLHAVTIIGFKTGSDGKKTFLVKNSWGENQCDDFQAEVKKCVRKGKRDCVDISDLTCRDDNYEVSEGHLKAIMLDYAKIQ